MMFGFRPIYQATKENQTDEQSVSELISRVGALEEEIKVLKTKGEIDRFISDTEKDSINETVKVKISDSVWSDFIYFVDLFSSNDKYSTDDATGAGVVATANTGYLFRSFPTTSISHTKETYFRVLVTASNPNSTILISTLDNEYDLGSDWSLVGFLISDSKVFGYTGARGETSMAQLIEYEPSSTAEYLDLELRYFPGDHVDFYIDGIFRGSLASTLPWQTGGTQNGNDITTIAPFKMLVASSSGTSSATVEKWEFLQKRT